MAEDKKQQNTPKLVVAHAKSLKIAPRKMRLVTNLIKNMRATDAITQLQFTNKKGSPMLIKLIRSAMANGEHNFQISPEDLYVKTITCDMGQTMSRYFPRARGSAFVIRRKMSHVHLTLEERPGKKAKKPVKTVKREEKPKETGIGTPDDTAKTPIELKPEVKQKPIKTSEQVKANTVAQKRRPRQTQNKG